MYETKLVARIKKYNETEVIEKAMHLFWKNGYEATSMQMLEKEMGINKFSIYASFKNKDGVFTESLNCYKEKLNVLIQKLRSSNNGVKDIEIYFNDFIVFSKGPKLGKGCLVTNSVNEIGNNTDEDIKTMLSNFLKEIKDVFAEKLKQNSNKTEALINEQADFLVISIFGLANASKIFNKEQTTNYIKNIFRNI